MSGNAYLEIEGKIRIAQTVVIFSAAGFPGITASATIEVVQ